MSARLGLALALVAFAFAVGCSSSGRTGSADLAGTGVHAGSGAVALYQSPKMPSGLGVLSIAGFRRDNGPTPMIPCTTQMVAGCTARTCTSIQDLGVAPPPDPVSAGVVAVGGGSAPFTITPASDNSYSSSSASDLWQGGEALTASAPGGVAPGFTLMLMAPDRVTFTGPTAPVMLTSGQDLMLPTASTDTVTVAYSIVFDQQMPTSKLDVSCSLTPAGGAVTVPGAALALAPKNKSFGVGASITSTSMIDLSGWTISFSATSVATFPGQLATVQVTLQ